MMKTKIRQTACILAAAAVLTASLTACGDGAKESGGSTGTSGQSDAGGNAAENKGTDEMIKLLYQGEELKAPEGYDFVEAAAPADSGFVTVSTNSESQTTDKIAFTRYDSEGNITETKEIALPAAEGSRSAVNACCIGEDGTFYYASTAQSGEEYSASFNAVKPDGTVVYTVDLKELNYDPNMDYISAVCADSKGRVLMCTGSMCLAFDEKGEIVFNETSDFLTGGKGYLDGAARGTDGNVYAACVNYESGEDGSVTYTTAYSRVDFDSKKTEECFKISGYGEYPYTGFGDYLLCTCTGSIVKGIKEDGTSEDIINLSNAGIDAANVVAFAAAGDNFMAATVNTAYERSATLIRKLDDSEAKERIKLSLTALEISSALRSAVVKYNNQSDEFFFEVTDYSGDDFETAKSKVNAEMSAGNIPDIISVGEGEIGEYAKKGVLIDLNTFIDGEDGLDRSNYFDNIFRGMETGGKLYAITDEFAYMGFAAKKSIIPEDGITTYEKIEEIRKDYPDIDVFPSNAMTKTNFLDGVIQFGIQQYLNKDTGECNFDSDEFRNILKLANEYPDEIDESLAMDENAEAEMQTQYMENRTLFMPFTLSNYVMFNLWSEGWFGEKDISVSGFPGINMGPVIIPMSSIAISSKSAHPDACWELIKLMLSDEVQTDSSLYFPVNKTAQKAAADKEIAEYADVDDADMTFFVNGIQMKLSKPDQALVDRVDGLIEGATNIAYYDTKNISEIIMDEAATYFSGAATVETASANIQNRVTLYLSEHE